MYFLIICKIVEYNLWNAHFTNDAACLRVPIHQLIQPIWFKLVSSLIFLIIITTLHFKAKCDTFLPKIAYMQRVSSFYNIAAGVLGKSSRNCEFSAMPYDSCSIYGATISIITQNFRRRDGQVASIVIASWITQWSLSRLWMRNEPKMTVDILHVPKIRRIRQQSPVHKA